MEVILLYVIFVVNPKNKMIYISREVSKLVLFTLLWGFPIFLAHINKDNHFLWFFIVSAFFTFVMFSHYESLEKIDSRHSHIDSQDLK